MVAANWGGKDRRRRLSRQEAGDLFARATGKCEKCGTPLGVDWHQAHLVAHSHGGATSLDQMQAWCRDCNLRQGSQDVVPIPGLIPRTWQREALPTILERLWQTGTSTVHAAPGAGKTFFAAMVLHRLVEAGLVRRMVVVVPNTALQRQWSDALAKTGIYLDWRPRDGYFEHPDSVGCVITYHSLANATAGLIQRMQEPTLLVLDEVHHVGDKAAWGKAVLAIAGDTSAPETQHAAAVLNMTGTLFRSTGAQRIGSVRYETVEIGGVQKFQAIADYSVKASDLIGIELRRPDLYAYGAEVELVDVREETTVAGDIADLEQGSQLSTTIRGAFKRREHVRQFATEAYRLLAQQLATIDNAEPLKMLWVADDQKAARMAAEEIDKVAGHSFARLVISDEPGSINTLRAAAKEKRPCAIVSVRMVTEGFDCPQLSVIAYASATIAPLTLAQTMARAMRVTDKERADRSMLPAQILIADNDVMRKAFATALVGQFHILEVPRDDEVVAQDPLGGGGGDAIRLSRYELADLSSIDLRSATVLGEEDGTVPADELNEGAAMCRELSIPEVYAARVVVAGRRLRARLPVYVRRDDEATAEATIRAATALVEKPIDPRGLNLVRRNRIDQVAKWMFRHVEHDSRWTSVGQFQYQANNAAGLPAKGGRENATPEQLAKVEAWMLERVREHCNAHADCALPTVARDDQQP